MSEALDAIDAFTLAGRLRKVGKMVERAAKHPKYGSQKLWDISAGIKQEAARILEGTESGNGEEPAHNTEAPTQMAG